MNPIVPSVLTYCDVDDDLLRVWGIVDCERYEYINLVLRRNADRLTDGLGRPELVTELAQGDIVLVKQDGQFKRASIIGREPGTKTFKVRFIDFGNMGTFSLDDLRKTSAIPHIKALDGPPCVHDYILGDALVKPNTSSVEDMQLLNLTLLDHGAVRFIDTVAEKTLISWSVHDSTNPVPFSTLLVQLGIGNYVTVSVIKAAVKRRYTEFREPTTIPPAKIHQPMQQDRSVGNVFAGANHNNGPFVEEADFPSGGKRVCLRDSRPHGTLPAYNPAVPAQNSYASSDLMGFYRREPPPKVDPQPVTRNSQSINRTLKPVTFSSHSETNASQPGIHASQPGPRPSQHGPRPLQPGPRPFQTGPPTSQPGSHAFQSGIRAFQPGPRPSQPGPRSSQPVPRPSQHEPRPSQPGPRALHPGPRPSQHEPHPSQPGPRALHPGPRPSQHEPRPSQPGPRPFQPGPRALLHGPRASQPGPRAFQSGIRASEPTARASLPEIHVLQYQVEKLPVGSSHEVLVSHVVDGAQSFMVQLKKNLKEERLQRLMDRLNDSKIRAVPIELSYVGLICMARSPKDNRLHRAVVSTVLHDGANLLFVDFGKIETVPLGQIYKLPTRFLEEPVMALQFSLTRLSTNLTLQTPKANQIFEKLTANVDSLILTVTKPEIPSKQFCNLFLHDGKGAAKVNIKQKMLEEIRQVKPGRPAEYEKISLKRNSSNDVMVVHIESCFKFFVFLRENRALLDTLVASLQEYCNTSAMKNFSTIEEVYFNMPVCCQIKGDFKWQRGLIAGEPMDDGTVLVFLVDYGFAENVHFRKLRMISFEMISKLPMQAIECRLDIGAEFAFEERVIDAFIGMATNSHCTMKVIDVLRENVLLVDIINDKNENVKDSLQSEFGLELSDEPEIIFAKTASKASNSVIARNGAKHYKEWQYPECDEFYATSNP